MSSKIQTESLTPSQLQLKSHLDLQLRLFKARDWTKPRFPWPLIVAPTNAGVSTTVKSLGLPVLVLDAIQWGIIGGRSTPTLLNILKWADTNIGIVLIKNLHLLNAVTLDVPWFRAVQSEITALLDGFISSELVAENQKLQEVAKLLPKRVFFIGHGNWDIADGTPIMTTDDEYRDSHTKELSTQPELLARFHSQCVTLAAPTVEDWENLIQAYIPECPPARVHTTAVKRAKEQASLSKLGEIISDWMLDRPLPDKPSTKPTKQVVSQPETFTLGRLKLLLCKIYGDAARYPLLKADIEKTITQLDKGNDISTDIGKIISKLNTSKYNIPDEDIKVFFSKSIATAANLAAKITVHNIFDQESNEQ